jgi:hypothetical protein
VALLAGDGLALVVLLPSERGARPRSFAPWRSTMRYTDDSPTPNFWLISGTGVLVSAYRRVTSRSCSSVSLRRAVTPRRLLVDVPFLGSVSLAPLGALSVACILRSF